MFSQYFTQFPQFFSNTVIKELANKGSSPFISYVMKESGYLNIYPKKELTYREFFDDIFGLLIDEYRCEYVYKNAIARQLLLNRHSIENSSILSEFRAGTAIADLVILNGNSSVYEIKTELDTLDRLDGQLSEYKKVFGSIYIVTHPSYIRKIENQIEDNIGLIELTEDFKIRTLREAKSNRKNVIPSVIFDSLRKNEYCQIIKKEFGFIPDVPNTKIYTECRTLFKSLSPEVAHDNMVEILRTRTQIEQVKKLLLNIPDSLIMACLDNKLNDKEWIKFQAILDNIM